MLMATTSSAFGSEASSCAGQADRERRADEHADRGPDGAEGGGGGDAQCLQAGRIQAERVADEIQLAAEMRGLRLGRHARHLPLQPAPQGRRQALDERLLQLQRDGALAEADLLAGEALAGERCSVRGT